MTVLIDSMHNPVLVIDESDNLPAHHLSQGGAIRHSIPMN